MPGPASRPPPVPAPPAQPGARSGAAGLPPALLIAGVMLVAINLRPAAASIGPLLDRIQADTGLSSGAAGVLATLPVLCFGLLAPAAPPLARRLGLRPAVAASMVVLLAGLLVRLLPGTALLFAGTAIAGAGIATGNVLVPVLIRRDLADRTGTAMALYTTSLIAFAALAAGVTVPVADVLGGGWRAGLAVWALPAAVAAAVWAPAWLRRRRPAVSEQPSRAATISIRPLLRSRLAWQVTLFFALQSGGFYSTLAWLPSVFESHGAGDTQAGLLLSLTMVVGLPAALVIPGVAARARDQRALVALTGLLTAAGLAGILVAPMSAPYVWVVLLGVGQNAAFPVALMLILLRGGGVAGTERLSTMAQSIGYLLAAGAPVAVGAVHGAAASWSPAVAVLLALVVPQTLIGLAAGRNRRLSPELAGARADQA